MSTEFLFSDLASTPPRRDDRRWLTWFGIVAALSALALLAMVAAHHGAPLAPDARVRDVAYAHRTAALTAAAKVLHYAGKYYFVVLIGLVLALAAWRKGERRVAVGAAATPLGLAVILEAVKTLVGRPRPDALLRLLEESGDSFPSGHAAGTMAVCLLAIAFLRRYLRPRPARATAAVALVALPLAMGASRIYLGVHYLSDVTAGWLFGAAWFCACWRWARAGEAPIWEKRL